MVSLAVFRHWGLLSGLFQWHFLLLLASASSLAASQLSTSGALTVRDHQDPAAPSSQPFQQPQRKVTHVVASTALTYAATPPRTRQLPQHMQPTETPPYAAAASQPRLLSLYTQLSSKSYTLAASVPTLLKKVTKGGSVLDEISAGPVRESLLPSTEKDLHGKRTSPAEVPQISSGWFLSDTEESSLSRLLLQVVRQEMMGCALVVAYDSPYHHTRALQNLLQLSQPKQQVVEVGGVTDLAGMLWRSVLCRGYLLLLTDPAPLLVFANTDEDIWDFDGRFVVVGTTKEQLQNLALSKKGVKTEHLVGLVKSGGDGYWVLYTNTLYQDSLLRRLTTWRSTSFTTSTSLFPEKLSNLQGALLKVSTFEWEPSVLYYRDKNGTVQFPYGIDIEVVNALSRVLNFTVVFEEPPPGEFWGVMNDNGSWSGMMGRLSRSEADIGVANLFLTLDRLGAVDYSAPYDAEVSCFMVRSDPLAPRWLSLVLPFQGATWATLVGGVVITGLIITFLASVAARCGGGEVKNLKSPVFAFFFALSMHFRDPQAVLPRRIHMRIFISFLGLYTIIITTAYCSNLAAFLTVTRPPQGMDTVKELRDSGLQIAGLGGFFKGALASAVDPYLQSLAERFVAYQNLELVWPKLRKSRAAYLHNRQFLEFVITTQFTKQGVTSMRIMKECFAPYSIAMALQRHSPLKTNFDRVIRWMLESGLVRRWFLQSLRLSRTIQDKKASNEGDSSKSSEPLDAEEVASTSGVIQPLGIQHMQGLFFILIIGYLCSLLVFLLENCFKKLYTDFFGAKNKQNAVIRGN
ncbi:ionotropic receptor 21a [Cherax quadricarinatus]|uniref:ionotropic receptor 21a n=1 Tax=Cherax quadricarinatus TaxID=27406 RepID=UPI00387E85A7